jgi:YVTN family beta-propeller protein
MKTFFLVLYFAVFTSIGITQDLRKVYFLSEGGFSTGSSKLSLLDVTTGNFTSSIFSPGNLGLYPDGLILHDSFLYVTEQGNFGGNGKIYKLDTLGTVLSSNIFGTNPFSIAISNDKIFVTNGPASNVSVLNLNDLSVITTIAVGVYPQEILAYDGKVFVANNSLWGGDEDSTVSVIDAETNSVIHSINVIKDPSSLAISNNGQLLIGCPGDESTGKIFVVNTNSFQIVDEYTISTYGFGSGINVDKNSNTLYFIAYTNDVVKYDILNGTSELLISSVFPNNYYYGYGFDYLNDNHYVLDAKDFVVSGTISVFDNAGSNLNTYTAGVAPRRLLFKYNESQSHPFANIGLNLPISDFTNTEDSIVVNIPSEYLLNNELIAVEVMIDTVLHSSDGDLRFTLNHDGIESIIINQVGGSDDNFLLTKLKDEAELDISSGSAPFSGLYKPSNPLSVFNGMDPNGIWKLVVYDAATGNSGTLSAWGINLIFDAATSVDPLTEAIPDNFVLHQNYPNPFNPSTVIRYSVPDEQFITIKIYDILGNELSTLVNETKTAGTYEVDFSAKNLASGIYIYTLQSYSGVQSTLFSKKMTVIK